jgi:Phosphoenolpyruvate-dependent sugar phosphotransferase system, EIIA 2
VAACRVALRAGERNHCATPRSLRATYTWSENQDKKFRRRLLVFRHGTTRRSCEAFNPMNMAQSNRLPDATCTRDPPRIAAWPRSILVELLSEEDIILDLDAANKTGVFEFVANFLGERYGLDMDQVCASLAEREELGSTGLGLGIAIPHARVTGLHRAAAVFVRLRIPIAFDAGTPCAQACQRFASENPRRCRGDVLRSRLS